MSRPAISATSARAVGECGRIALDGDHPAGRGLENGAGIAARAERSVNVGFARCRLDLLQHFRKKHGNVCPHVPALRFPTGSPRRHSRALSSSPPLR